MKTCCICGSEFDGFGANPEPFDGEIGTCCQTCDERFVIPARILWGRDDKKAPPFMLVTLKRVASLGAGVSQANARSRELGELMLRRSATP